jgi:hypothetical protein
MANQKANTFADLVKQAPTQAAAEVVTVTGVLWQPGDPTKFGLTLANGRNVTFDIAAVRSHLVLCSSVGSTIVRVDIDSSLDPRLADGQRSGGWGGAGSAQISNFTGHEKPPKDPIGDTHQSDPWNFYRGEKPPKDPIGDTYDSDQWNFYRGEKPPKDPIGDTYDSDQWNFYRGGKPPKDPIGDTYDSDQWNFYRGGKPPKDPIGDTYDSDDPRYQFHGSGAPFYTPLVAPFALATPRQVPPHLVGYLQSVPSRYYPGSLNGF